ncbi:ABC transporter permease [Niveispirillum sp. KHB5.9]|uniref:ABC transporter permease n=1 Tax=Niveispirillum sp. KHB5.9 TaxID=3400269 RepID=UPI003A89749E
MLKNYLMVAFRNLLKHKLYSAINISGLAVGLATCVLILLFVRNETTHDRFFTDADRLYQVVIRAQLPGRQADNVASTMLPLAAALKESFPEIEKTARVVQSPTVFKRGDESFSEQVRLVDPDFFRMFDFTFLRGDRMTALDQPNGIVLTQSMAKKYFKDSDPLGQTLEIDGGEPAKVTGVIPDMPSDTHFDLEIIRPYAAVGTALRGLENNWGGICCETYLLLKPGADAAAINARLPAWIKTAAPTLNSPQGSVNLGEIFTPRIRNVKDIHTDPVQSSMRPSTSYAEILTFAAVAVLVLAIASINFMNLATARATQRAREVSVRKVVGASRGQIIMQFIGESLLLTLIGLLLSIALVELTLPAYSAFLDKELTFNLFTDPLLGPALLGLALVVGIAGGAYPAFFLSSFNPARVLKGASSGVGGGSGRLRMALVVVQFAISISLMVATTVVYGQLLYAQNKNLGFDKENTVILTGFPRGADRERQQTMVNTMAKLDGVSHAAGTDVTPGDGNENNTNVRMPGADPNQLLVLRQATVDWDYVKTLGLQLVAGRDFDRNRPADQLVLPPPPAPGAAPAANNGERPTYAASVILNEAAVKRLGFTSNEDALGKEFEAGGGNSTLKLTIIGVIADFHFRSVHDPIAPGMFYVDNGSFTDVLVRIKAGDTQKTLAAVERVWREMYPTRPVQREFLDTRIQNLYVREAKTSQMFATFSGLAILIACLGLFGLASFTAERRTKEIGLRKVLGASVTDIVRLLVWQFSKPVLVANLIAWPVAWYFMNDWLNGFTFRIDLNPLLFVAAGAVALAIAWLTVGLHAARVAQAKPVTALRYE